MVYSNNRREEYFDALQLSARIGGWEKANFTQLEMATALQDKLYINNITSGDPQIQYQNEGKADDIELLIDAMLSGVGTA